MWVRCNFCLARMIACFSRRFFVSHGMHGIHGTLFISSDKCLADFFSPTDNLFFLPQITQITLILLSFFWFALLLRKKRSADLHRFFTTYGRFCSSYESSSHSLTDNTLLPAPYSLLLTPCSLFIYFEFLSYADGGRTEFVPLLEIFDWDAIFFGNSTEGISALDFVVNNLAFRRFELHFAFC